MNYARPTSQLELWHVQIGNVVRTMTLDELDNAYQAGFVDERAMVLKAGDIRWTTLSQAAGLDEPVHSQPNSIAPFATDIASSNVAFPRSYPLPTFDTSFGTEERSVFRPKRNIGGVLAVLTMAAMLAGGGFAVKKYGVGQLRTHVASLMKSRHGEAARAVAIATPPPPAAATPPPKPASALPAPAQAMAINSLPSATPDTANANKTPAAAPGKKKTRRAKAAPSNGEATSTPKAADPTERGDGQFDPLNGKI